MSRLDVRFARVLDAGCGSGILGLLALKHGAEHVYFVESNASIALARRAIAEAGFTGRATFLNESTFAVELDPRVDLVVCDHVGFFGFDYGLLDLLSDARTRLLKPGGTLIPSKLDLFIGAVACSKANEIANAWQASIIPREFHWVKEVSLNKKHAVNFVAQDVCSSVARICSLSTHDVPEQSFRWNAQLTASKDVSLDGIAGWFNAELAPDVWMTNSPLSDRSIQRPQAFFPIGESLVVREGDSIDVTIFARPADDLISWIVTHSPSGKVFRHSTGFAMPLELESLARARTDHVPKMTRDGEIRRLILKYCDGKRTVADIVAQVRVAHGPLFRSESELQHAVSVALRSNTQ
ncbi:MAG: methyltransferase domain-containing protein [Casimicrobium sp.]